MTIQRTAAVAASSLAMLLALAGCGERPQGDSVGQRLDSAVDRTGQAAGQARQSAREATAGAANSTRLAGGEGAGKARDAAANAAAGARDAGQQARTSVLGAGADTRRAAAGAGALAGAKVDDAQITSRVSASLMGDRELSSVRIDVDTRDGVVTLSGPVPSSSVKARANEIAQAVKDVKSVNNQLTVSAS